MVVFFYAFVQVIGLLAEAESGLSLLEPLGLFVAWVSLSSTDFVSLFFVFDVFLFKQLGLSKWVSKGFVVILKVLF